MWQTTKKLSPWLLLDTLMPVMLFGTCCIQRDYCWLFLDCWPTVELFSVREPANVP